jgi:hypothetical protein
VPNPDLLKDLLLASITPTVTGSFLLLQGWLVARKLDKVKTAGTEQAELVGKKLDKVKDAATEQAEELKEVHTEVNSRMTELLSTTKALAEAVGAKRERARVKKAGGRG